jgi:Fe-S-cluster containining protein
MSGGFKCQMCGWCCGHLVDSGWSGLSLFPWEKHLFTGDKVQPHLGIGAAPDDDGFRVFLYRYVNPVCEKLRDGRCTIHETRPLVCRSYPFRYMKKGDAVAFEAAPECTMIDPVAAPWSSRKFPELYAAEEIGMHLELFYKRREPKWVYDPISGHWVPLPHGKGISHSAH